MLLMIQLTIGSVCLIRCAESGNQKIDGGGGRLMDRGEGTGPGVLVPVCVFFCFYAPPFFLLSFSLFISGSRFYIPFWMDALMAYTRRLYA